jgi:hypothetical protein
MEDVIFVDDINPDNEKYQVALKLVGISETGELLEDRLDKKNDLR